MASPGAFSTAVYSSLANKAIPLSQLFSKIKESGAEVVSIGEATHGSKQFYSFRGELTKQLIISNLCDGILIEGDFPDTAALHRYVMGFGTEKETSVDSALSGFARFPRWMWRNETFKSFLVWLHDHNSLLPMDQRVGIWGLDVYSLHISMGEIFKYLEAIDPDVAQQVKELYTCYDRSIESPVDLFSISFIMKILSTFCITYLDSTMTYRCTGF
jgi:erythromycin esterase-like protein